MEVDEGRIGGMKHHLSASLEWPAMCLRSVGVCLMALGYAKMFTGDFLGETIIPYEICNELRGFWDEG